MNWESKTENAASWRELDFPMLGQTLIYTVRENDLILSNDVDFLREILARKSERKSDEFSDESFSELMAINLEQKENAFDEVFDRINENATEDNFFTGNISSLLDSISEVKRIEIRKNYSQNILEEQLIFALQ